MKTLKDHISESSGLSELKSKLNKLSMSYSSMIKESLVLTVFEDILSQGLTPALSKELKRIVK